MSDLFTKVNLADPWVYMQGTYNICATWIDEERYPYYNIQTNDAPGDLKIYFFGK